MGWLPNPSLVNLFLSKPVSFLNNGNNNGDDDDDDHNYNNNNDNNNNSNKGIQE